MPNLLNKFIKRVTLFLLPVGLLTAAVEMALRHIPNDYQKKYQAIQTKGPNWQVWILGSSQGMYGLNPHWLNLPAYNGAHLSQSHAIDAMLVSHFHQSLTNLRHIIVPVSYFSLYHHLPASAESWRQRSYHLYYHMSVSRQWKYAFELPHFRLPMQMNRLWDYYLKGIDERKTDHLGFGINYRGSSILPLHAHAQQEAQLHNRALSHHLTINADAITSICRLAQKRNISVWILAMPVHGYYQAAIDAERWQNALAQMEKISARESNVQFKDFTHRPILPDSMFYDATHLNEQGAGLFTRHVAGLLATGRKSGLQP